MQKAYTQLALSSAASRGGGSPRPACHPVSLAPMGGAADDPQILDPPFSTVMSCFAQTLCAFGRIFSTGAVREYAEEVMQWSSQSSTEEEKKVLIELAFTWTQAASLSERKSVGPLRA